MMAMSMLAFDELTPADGTKRSSSPTEATRCARSVDTGCTRGAVATRMALVAGNRGDREACRDICEAMIEWGAPRQLGRLADWAHHALARAALGAGDFEECYAHASAISPPGTLGSHNPQALWAALDLVDAARAHRTHDEARAHADAMRRADLGRLSPRFALVTAAAGAMVASDDEAPELFDAGARTAGHRGVAVRARACATRVRRTPAAAAPDP